MNITFTNSRFTPGYHARTKQTLPFVEEEHRTVLKGHIKYHKIRHSNHLHRVADLGGVVVMEKIMLYMCVNLLFPDEYRAAFASMSVFDAVATALSQLVIECRPNWPDIKAKWDFRRDYFNSQMLHWFHQNHYFCMSVYRAVGVNLMTTRDGQVVPVDTFPAMHHRSATVINDDNTMVNIGVMEPMKRRLFAFLSVMRYVRFNETMLFSMNINLAQWYLTNRTLDSLAVTCRALSRTFHHLNFDTERHNFFENDIMIHGYEFAQNREIHDILKFHSDISSRVILDMLEYHEDDNDNNTAEEPRCKRHKFRHSSWPEKGEEIHFLE